MTEQTNQTKPSHDMICRHSPAATIPTEELTGLPEEIERTMDVDAVLQKQDDEIVLTVPRPQRRTLPVVEPVIR